MSTTISRDEAVPVPEVIAGPGRGRRWRRWRAVGAAVAASWLVPLATHAVGLDALLPPLLLVALMSLGRGGARLTDRFAVAFGQLFGAFCAAGLVISVWPWHLHPVPVAGCAFTALVLLALATGRAPSLPRRLRAPDVLVVAGTAGVALLVLIPYLLRDLGGRLGIVALGEDFARHFLLYDMMGRFGGYAFLHAREAAAYVPDYYGTGVTNYPQGTHFLYTVLNAFWRSSGTAGDAPSAMDFMLWAHLGTYVFLAYAVLWGVRRIAGPGPGALRLIPVFGVVAVLLYLGDLITVYLRGYPNELMGLALLALLTAVLSRPLPYLGEQVVTVVALLVGISFSYFLFLPYAMLGAAIWALTRRRHLWRRRWIVAVSLLFGTLTLLTPLLNKPSDRGGSLILQGGTAVRGDRPVVLALMVLAMAAVVARRGLRAPHRRMMAVQLAIALALVALLAAYQFVMLGHTLYYFEKILHMATVALLVALGAAARLLPAWRPAPRNVGWPARARPLVPGGAVVAAVAVFMALLGGPLHLTPLGGGGLQYAVAINRGSPVGGRDAFRIARMYPDGGGRVNVDLMHTPYANFYGTLFSSVMMHDYKYGADWYGHLYPPGKAMTLADLERMVVDSKVPVRFLVQSPKASFLVVDPEHPNRPRPGPGVDQASFGDPAAPDNMTAVAYLARKYPEKVEVVRAPAQWAG